ncbi:MAG: uracil-DNA glycosylase [Candidatus Eisenbacteria bacterium]|uniref:Type-5 uracil-DNA glycosylase n=1 Tax=Eiseniibacteriota bacterium TaxID=2212470 RepID=A0A948RS70_UNCEI|nr:uracil-DNA glycosylase [Candidatus Eisenbacteria bacterium]MBU1951004.1 uracil-DNA glycosylase [Candidatus Eisenbacteria bacterium]MBU2690033.1 uracil-DNA glycosylase [Candidatus Eisenbacteria bacterium]
MNHQSKADPPPAAQALNKLAQRIINCRKCPRLSEYIRAVAQEKRRAYIDQDYWGRPVPGFGDPRACLLIVGLAPGAHGSNRTGRMFTGDASGDWLFGALHRHGFANRALALNRQDGLQLKDAFITAAGRCAPPRNKPTSEELAACRPYLLEELDILNRLRMILCLGKIAFDATLKALADRGTPWPGAKPIFKHAAVYQVESKDVPLLMASYHPSRQNTQTGRLTSTMWDGIFTACRRELD